MVVTCPRCRRSLSSVSADAPPQFCMYCGQKLTDSAPAETRTGTFTPQSSDGLSGVSDGRPHGATPEPDGGAYRFGSGDVPPAPEPAPREIGGYRLLKLLGAGGMGTVYEAEAPHTGTRVAVKLLSSRLAANPSSVERFRQEGRLASQLAHPRCVFVLSADTDAGRPYIVMELMPGRTLKDLIDERGPMAPAEAIARVLDVIDGLAEAHRVGMIHRDVKPSNCFLTADDRVKVGDFGLSKSLAASGANHLTQTGTFLGTVLFASPEQIRGEPLDYSSDVYSVAATLFYLLCGKAPFQHESAAAVLARVVSEPPPRVRKVRKDVSARLERVITKGLERDRGRRWQTLDDLREALLALLPERQRPARPRALVGAYFLDFLLTLAILTPLEVVQTAFGGLRTDVAGVPVNLIGWALVVAYFALLEGLTGTTAGKALLGLRVSRVGQTGPPGVWRGAVRATAFALIWMWIVDGSRLAVLLGASAQAVAGGFGLFVLGTGFAALAVQLRKRWGFRGLHDFASGCHVTQKPMPARKLRLVIQQPTPLDTVLPPAGDALPETVGGYVIRGRLSADSNGEQVWAAEDRALGRAVLLWLRPWGGAALPADPARPTRLRRLGTGTVAWGGAGYDWAAYAAPMGGPLVETIRPGRPLPWADARYLLEQLADEFRAAQADGSVPPRLALDHVWVEPNGRVQVLDFPLCAARYRPNAPLAVLREAASLALEGQPRSTTGGVSAPLPAHAMPVLNRLFATDLPLAEFQKELAETHAHRPEVTPAVRAAHLGMQAVLLAVPLAVLFSLAFTVAVGKSFEAEMHAAQARWTVAALADPVERAKLAESSPRALDAALVNPRLQVRVTDLAARTQAEADLRRAALLLPQRWWRDRFRPDPERTAGPTAAREIVLWAGAPDKSAAGRSDSPWSHDEALTFAAFAAVLLGMVLLAAILRGGVSLMLTGVAIVRADGRPASRRQCAARAALVWLPVAGLLFGSTLLQVYAPRQAHLAAGLWLAAAALLPVYAAVALRFPTRPPQDRLVGTYLVPV